MALKTFSFAVLEAVQQEMQRNDELTLLYEYQRPTAISPMGKVIDLYREFGPVRVPDWGPIDEEWFVGACAGMAMTGVPAIARCPSMTKVRAFELVFNQVGKLRHMTGGQASMPWVLWQDGAGRMAGSAGQHADAGMEAWYAAIPGVKVAVPSTPYDAKGLMAAAIRDPDPVVYFDYAPLGRLMADVPDEPYTVPLGQAAVRHEGHDITLVGVGPAALEIQNALPQLESEGISAEFIDPRTIKPLDLETILQSVRKTGRLLAVDHGHYTGGTASQIVAQVAVHAPGVRVAMITFPDAPPPGAAEMITWMTPDAPKIVDAVKKLVAGTAA